MNLQSQNTLKLSELNTADLNRKLLGLSTVDILKWAWKTFAPNVITTSSFQTQSLPLLHQISQVCPEMSVAFLDTGFHFSETLRYRDELAKLFNLNLKIIHPSIAKNELFYRYGEGLYRRDPDLCCYINKVKPLQQALGKYSAWISGVRFDQTNRRRNLDICEMQTTGLLKIHPMLNWTKKDISEYIDKFSLPVHPLFLEGYSSIGCAPCTSPVFFGGNDRAGRWAGITKTECGLHLELTDSNEQNK